MLELIQSWATAAEGRPTLGYMNEVYRTLQREGYQFPPKEHIASSMLDSSAPPEWTDSDVCMRCRTPFTFTNRKHHCRNCGNVFCGACSSKSISLPHLGIMDPVRVDDGCHEKLTEKSRGPRPFDVVKPQKTLYQGSMQPRNARVEDSFDADLKRALEMSLEDAKSNNSSGYVSQSPVQDHSKPKGDAIKHEVPSDEDADLAAAIAASLADMEEQKKKYAATFRQQTAKANGVAPFIAPKNEYELTPVEAENINLFSTLVDRLQHQPPGTILREPQIQELYESIGKLRPKLARTYGETMSKHGKISIVCWRDQSLIKAKDTLLDLHAKLSTVVRYYDRMLEERLSNTYSQTTSMYGLPMSGQHSTSNIYPSVHSSVHNTVASENYYSGNTLSGAPQPHSQYEQRLPQSYTQPPPPEQFQQPSQPYPSLTTHSGGTNPAHTLPKPSHAMPSSSQQPYQGSTHSYPSQSSAAISQQGPPSTALDAESSSFYYGESTTTQRHPPSLHRTQSYASQSGQQVPSSPQAYSRAQPQQTPLSPPVQPTGAWQNPPYPRQDLPPTWQPSEHNQQSSPSVQSQHAPPQQQHWQQQQQQQQSVPPQSGGGWQQAPYATGGYGPESFPSAPQQQIPAQQKVIDEPLIDL